MAKFLLWIVKDRDDGFVNGGYVIQKNYLYKPRGYQNEWICKTRYGFRYFDLQGDKVVAPLYSKLLENTVDPIIFLTALETLNIVRPPRKLLLTFFFNNLTYSSKRWFLVFRGSVGIRFWQKFSLCNDELH